MSRDIDLTVEKLSDDDQRYVDARNWLRQAREDYLAHPSAHSEDSETVLPGDADEDGVLSPEEWVAQATKDEIKAELDRREISYPAKATHDDLGALLLEAV